MHLKEYMKVGVQAHQSVSFPLVVAAATSTLGTFSGYGEARSSLLISTSSGEAASRKPRNHYFRLKAECYVN